MPAMCCCFHFLKKLFSSPHHQLMVTTWVAYYYASGANRDGQKGVARVPTGMQPSLGPLTSHAGIALLNNHTQCVVAL